MIPPAEDQLAVPAGSFCRRPERGSDAAFCYALFCQSRGPGEDFAFIDPSLRDQLLRQQFAGQSATYHAQYPDARFEILEQGGVPIGRIVTERAADALTIVDIALLPDWRGRGIGTQVLAAIRDEAQASGLPVRLSVFLTNTAALRLYERLGFAPVAASEIDMVLEWRPRSA
jgi:ribosomal protein S18 acetylase RimI-like enzyme